MGLLESKPQRVPYAIQGRLKTAWLNFLMTFFCHFMAMGLPVFCLPQQEQYLPIFLLYIREWGVQIVALLFMFICLFVMCLIVLYLFI